MVWRDRKSDTRVMCGDYKIVYNANFSHAPIANEPFATYPVGLGMDRAVDGAWFAGLRPMRPDGGRIRKSYTPLG